LLGCRGENPPCFLRIFLSLSNAMARYEHLPIYKKAMDVAIYFEKVVA